MGFNSSKSIRERRDKAQTLPTGIEVIWRSLLRSLWILQWNGKWGVPNPKAQTPEHGGVSLS